MTYDQWKTRLPDDDAPVCERCGGWMRLCDDLCDACAEEDEFYRWEPIPHVLEDDL